MADATITLRFSLPPAGLRRNHEANRYKANALKDAYSSTMLYEFENAPEFQFKRFKGDLAAEVIWRQCGDGDVDNTLSALKPMFDNLGCAPVTKAGANRWYIGLYESDSQIKRICVERERVSKKAEECVIVKLRQR